MPGVALSLLLLLASSASCRVYALPYGTPLPGAPATSSGSGSGHASNSSSGTQPRQAQPNQQQTSGTGQPAPSPAPPTSVKQVSAPPTCPAALQPAPDSMDSMSALEQQFLGSCPVVVSYAVASTSATPDSPFCATATLTNNQQGGVLSWQLTWSFVDPSLSAGSFTGATPVPGTGSAAGQAFRVVNRASSQGIQGQGNSTTFAFTITPGQASSRSPSPASDALSANAAPSSQRGPSSLDLTALSFNGLPCLKLYRDTADCATALQSLPQLPQAPVLPPGSPAAPMAAPLAPAGVYPPPPPFLPQADAYPAPVTPNLPAGPAAYSPADSYDNSGGDLGSTGDAVRLDVSDAGQGGPPADPVPLRCTSVFCCAGPSTLAGIVTDIAGSGSGSGNSSSSSGNGSSSSGGGSSSDGLAPADRSAGSPGASPQPAADPQPSLPGILLPPGPQQGSGAGSTRLTQLQNALSALADLQDAQGITPEMLAWVLQGGNASALNLAAAQATAAAAAAAATAALNGTLPTAKLNDARQQADGATAPGLNSTPPAPLPLMPLVPSPPSPLPPRITAANGPAPDTAVPQLQQGASRSQDAPLMDPQAAGNAPPKQAVNQESIGDTAGNASAGGMAPAAGAGSGGLDGGGNGNAISLVALVVPTTVLCAALLSVLSVVAARRLRRWWFLQHHGSGDGASGGMMAVLQHVPPATQQGSTQQGGGSQLPQQQQDAPPHGQQQQQQQQQQLNQQSQMEGQTMQTAADLLRASLPEASTFPPSRQAATSEGSRHLLTPSYAAAAAQQRSSMSRPPLLTSKHDSTPPPHDSLDRANSRPLTTTNDNPGRSRDGSSSHSLQLLRGGDSVPLAIPARWPGPRGFERSESANVSHWQHPRPPPALHPSRSGGFLLSREPNEVALPPPLAPANSWPSAYVAQAHGLLNPAHDSWEDGSGEGEGSNTATVAAGVLQWHHSSGERWGPAAEGLREGATLHRCATAADRRRSASGRPQLLQQQQGQGQGRGRDDTQGQAPGQRLRRQQQQQVQQQVQLTHGLSVSMPSIGSRESYMDRWPVQHLAPRGASTQYESSHAVPHGGASIHHGTSLAMPRSGASTCHGAAHAVPCGGASTHHGAAHAVPCSGASTHHGSASVVPRSGASSSTSAAPSASANAANGRTSADLPQARQVQQQVLPRPFQHQARPYVPPFRPPVARAVQLPAGSGRAGTGLSGTGVSGTASSMGSGGSTAGHSWGSVPPLAASQGSGAPHQMAGLRGRSGNSTSTDQDGLAAWRPATGGTGAAGARPCGLLHGAATLAMRASSVLLPLPQQATGQQPPEGTARSFTCASSSATAAAIADSSFRAASLASGGAASPFLDFEPAAVVLGAKLGSGGFGQVFCAQVCGDVALAAAERLGFALPDPEAGLQVAVKMVPVMHDGDSLDSRNLHMLRHEVKVLSQLQHPRIVQFLGAYLLPPHICIVEELAEGGSLHARLHARDRQGHKLHPPLTLEQVLQLGIDVASAMVYLHPNIVHRDLKPQNCLLDRYGRAKLCDFGLVKVKTNTWLSTKNVHAGTTAFMAPEQFGGQQINEKVDVYAFAVLLYECITGDQAWADLDHPMQIIFHVGVHCRRPPLPDDCPPPLASLIQRCWQDDPAARPAFTEVLHLLQAFQEELLGHLGASSLGGAVAGG